MSGLESYRENVQPQFPISENAEFTRRVERAEALYAGADFEGAKKFYLDALTHAQAEGAAIFNLYKNLGNIEMRSGDVDAAEEYYNRAYAIDPNSSVLMVNFGSLGIIRQDLARAVECFRRAVEIDPNMAKGWAGLATIHREFGDHELAWANAERALDIDPSLQVVIHLVAEWALRDNEIERSIRLLDRYVRYQPSDLEMKVMLAQFLYFMGRLELASNEIKAAMKSGASSELARSLFTIIHSERASRDTRFK